MSGFRSSAWLEGDDEVALLHRVALAQTGYRRGHPVVGIAATASAFNPCHGDVDRLVSATSTAVEDAGGVAAVFPAMSLGEDLMKPSAMMYRNLLAMEFEETVRSSPIDGLVIFAGCDKNVPAALMALASCDRPSLVGLVGVRKPGRIGERRVAAGTDVWREFERRRSGQADDKEWAAFEQSLHDVGPGICNVMGTALTMGLLTEVLGMALPGSTTMQAGSAEILEAAQTTGRRVVEMVAHDDRPSRRMSRAAFDNALTMLAAVGGSTNAVIHLAAVAGRLGFRLDPATVDAVLSRVPLLADIEPCGSGLAQDLHDAGSTPALVAALGDLFDQRCHSADGRPWSAVVADIGDPADVDKPVGINNPADVNDPVGINHPADVNDPVGINHPADVNDPVGINHPADVNDPAGINHPADVNESADVTDPADVAGRPQVSATIRTRDDPVSGAPVIAMLGGSLAPGGAVIKVAAASPDLLRHAGPAVVFDDYHDMRRRLDDPELQVAPSSVIVVRDCGPAGAPGMPEWGMAPIPRRLADQGVTDMLRVSDGRMSGTSFGTVVLHVTPEANRGGPLALVQDGDIIELDVPARRLDLQVDDAEIAERRAAWVPTPSPHQRGWPAMYRRHVLDATSGCDLDFLVPQSDGQAVFIEPVVGRS